VHPEQIILEQLVTEKAVGARALSRYAFKVHLNADKVSIASAIEKIFKVKVVSVNTLKIKPKIRRRGYQVGKKSGFKKAYVTLKQGQKIEELEV